MEFKIDRIYFFKPEFHNIASHDICDVSDNNGDDDTGPTAGYDDVSVHCSAPTLGN